MIDVSRFHIGDRCPRCVERRVIAVNLDDNLWMCVPNPMPFPFRESVIRHDAAEWDEFSSDERKENAENMMKLINQAPSTDHGAGDGR